jgi:hypothetical protein
MLRMRSYLISPQVSSRRWTAIEFDEMKTRTIRWLVPATLVVVWLVYIISRMIADAHADLGPTGLPGDLRNQHNRPGELSTYVEITIVEFAAILAILRPWSYQQSWERAFIALALLTPWAFIFLALMIHSGGIMVAHFVWLSSLWLGLLLLVIVSAAMHFLSRRISSDPQAI